MSFQSLWQWFVLIVLSLTGAAVILLGGQIGSLV